MSLGKAPGAGFEISIDGMPRSHSLVAVKDLKSGKAVALDQKLRLV
jgi:hypothetical protein